jgi:hypothetical protein
MGRNAQRRRAARAAQRQPVQSQPVLFYDVELRHLDDEPELFWSAERAISGDSSGARFESTDTLTELVADRRDLVHGGAD